MMAVFFCILLFDFFFKYNVELKHTKKRYIYKKVDTQKMESDLHLKYGGKLGHWGLQEKERYRPNPIHTNPYQLFDSNHQLEHKLGVISTLTQYWRVLNTQAYKTSQENIKDLRQPIQGVC